MDKNNSLLELAAQPTEEEINKLFEALKYRLSYTLLNTEEGRKRKADAGEFMFMSISEKRFAMFKHIHTRNYVYLDMNNQNVLFVPSLDKPFFRGFFDIN